MSDADTGVSESEFETDRLEAHSKAIHDLRRRVEENEAKLAEKDEEIAELRSELADVDQRTDLQHYLNDAAAMKVEERAQVCIQTLVNKSQKRARNDDPPAASMDYNGADDALGGTLDDRQLYNALERAGELVEGDVVQFKKMPRSSPENSHLVVDMDKGPLPARFQSGENHGTEGR